MDSASFRNGKVVPRGNDQSHKPLFQGERYDGWFSGTRADNLGRAITHSSQSGDKNCGASSHKHTDRHYVVPKTNNQTREDSSKRGLGKRYFIFNQRKNVVSSTSHNPTIYTSQYISTSAASGPFRSPVTINHSITNPPITHSDFTSIEIGERTRSRKLYKASRRVQITSAARLRYFQPGGVFFFFQWNFFL